MNWWRNKADKQRWWLRLALMTLLIVAITGYACGPFFPRWLLGNSDAAVQTVPFASFFKEIALWRKGTTSRYKTIPPKEEHSQAQQVLDADLTELRAALQARGINAVELEQILKAHQECREKLAVHAGVMADWLAEPFDWDKNLLRPMPEMGPLSIAKGLPPEFADYMRGSIAYHLAKTNDAVTAWTELLKRPAAERPYRTVWAEYMLGRVAVESDPKVAIPHFQKVRVLVQEGFADSTGLAAASLGWEARAWLNLKDYRRAVELYSEQVSSGDSQLAVVSLRMAAGLALKEGEAALRPLSQDATSRRVITVSLISQGLWNTALGDSPETKSAEVWLGLLEQNQATEVELAEQLALAAYQAGKFDVAERWVKRASQKSATARWIQAKLLLRNGKIEAATGILAGLAREFPVQPMPDHEDAVSSNLLDRLVTGENYAYGETSPSRQSLLGELGVLHLQRRDFVTSLDCLLKGGYWMDAAYVAERVLTLEELKKYVDRNWSDNQRKEKKETEVIEFDASGSIRSLLARRLCRENRLKEAAAYYPEEQAQQHQERTKWLAIGRDAKRPAKERAKALWEAAKITRAHGLELLGTEVEPDWAIYWGNFEVGVSVSDRWQQRTNVVLKTGKEELQRAAQAEVAPNARWHYRYLAADLGWQAAQLMPDQAPETARMLYDAGGWLKGNDPKSANRFYRALVLRCNKTELGALAEKLRWFPPLDENGKPFMPKRIPHAKAAPEPVDSFPVF
ncbi:MAG TPA: hypothetical protein VGH19_16910 [Verrucomicrobiae bacterium]